MYLIVDDNELFGIATARLLGPMAVYRSTISAGLAITAQLRPRLILLDIEFHAEAQYGPDWIPRFLAVSPDSRIIVITGCWEDGEAEIVRDAGGLLYLEKGDPKLLVRAAKAVLDWQNPPHPHRRQVPA